MRALVLEDGEHYQPSSWDEASPPLSTEAIAAGRPDSQVVVLDSGDRLIARASMWRRAAPSLTCGPSGLIGYFAAANRTAARAALDAACLWLRGQGCALAIGPLDGSTWRNYRFVIESNGEPPFFLEPDHPRDWPCHFIDAGFRLFATYTSSLVERLDDVDQRVARARARHAANGVSIRTLDTWDPDAALQQSHALCCRSFAGNLLYTPIAEDEFISQQRRLWPFVDPRLVLLAECDGQLVGFVFALPDHLDPQRRTVVVKTLAVLPGGAPGLGAVLVAEVHARARTLGYTRAVHALMHDGNPSRNISRRYGRPFRRYGLFARTLGDVDERR